MSCVVSQYTDSDAPKRTEEKMRRGSGRLEADGRACEPSRLLQRWGSVSSNGELSDRGGEPGVGSLSLSGVISLVCGVPGVEEDIVLGVEGNDGRSSES